MTKSAMSLLMVAMMAASGFAAAQAPAMKAGTDGGSGPSNVSNGKSDTTRAAVKAEAVPMKSGTQGGEGAKPSDSNTPKAAPKMTAEEKKAHRAKARAARKARMHNNEGAPLMKDGKSSN
jgi:hypothetical protein